MEKKHQLQTKLHTHRDMNQMKELEVTENVDGAVQILHSTSYTIYAGHEPGNMVDRVLQRRRGGTSFIALKTGADARHI